MKSIRPICLACHSFEVEAVVEGHSASVELFSCFDCTDVFYFMADARPALRRLGLAEFYRGQHSEQKATDHRH